MTIATAQYLPTVVDGGTSWVNPNNVKLDDDNFALSTASRSLNYPYGYTQQRTSTLLCSAFTGVTTGMGVGDVIEGIEIEVRAKKSRADVDAQITVYATSTYGESETQQLTTEWSTYTFGSPTTTWGLYYRNPDGLANYISPEIEGSMTSGAGSVTISIEYVKIRAYWHAATCSPMTFTPTTNIPVGEWGYSNVVTVAGLPAGESVPWYFTGAEDHPSFEAAVEVCHNGTGEWRWNTYGDTVTCKNGDTFQFRKKFRAASIGEEESPELSINGYEPTWSALSTTPDRTPVVPTSIEIIKGLPRSQWVHGANYIVRGADAGNTGDMENVSDGLFGWLYVGSAVQPESTRSYYDPAIRPYHSYYDVAPVVRGPFDQTYTWQVANGTEISMDFVTPATFNTVTYAFVSAGSSSTMLYEFWTEDYDLTPDQVFFTPATVAPSAVATSNAVTISGINGTATVTFFTYVGSSTQWQKNGGTWTSSGTALTVVNGDTVAVRATAPGSGSTAFSVTITISGMAATFQAVTTGGDVTPDAITFTNQSDRLPGVLCTSNNVTISGATAGQTMYCSASPGFELSANGGAWGLTVGVQNGQTLAVRGYSSLQPGGVKTCTVTAGGTVAAAWTLTNRNATFRLVD